MKSLRDLAFKAYRRNPNDATWKTFCRYRNKVKSLLRKLIRIKSLKHFNNIESNNVWHRLQRIGCLDRSNNSPNLNVDEIAKYLQSCQKVDSASCTWSSGSSDSSNSFSFNNVSIDDLYRAFSKTKSNSVGPEGIPMKFLKILLPHIDLHVLHIVNTIHTTSV